jgi:branched-chain amino acid transport system substrate-binding protein
VPGGSANLTLESGRDVSSDPGGYSMRVRIIAMLAVLSLVALGCSNSDNKAGSSTTTAGGGGGGTAVDQPGVTSDTIRIGGVVSKTNALNGPYASAFDGVKAYFNMVNSEGGIYNRKLELVSERDDQMASNQQEVEALLAQDNVFAVDPIATVFLFSGAQKLADEHVPTFGWNINTEYTGHPNLFGSNYGALCLGCVGAQQPFVAKQLGKKKIGVLAYNQATSADCADGIQKSFEKYPTADVVFVTKSINFGDTDFSVEVGQMKDKGVDFVLTCIDNTAALNLAKEMRKQDMKATQYLPNGYDVNLIAANKEFFQGDIVGVPFVPFQFRPQPPGMVAFNKWMDKAGYEKNEIAINGWISAAMLYEGLKGAGPNFTRQKVIDYLNTLTDQTVGGLIPPRNWTKEHEITHDIACTAYVKVDNGKFVPTFNEPGKPFMCLPDQPAKLPATATFK